MPRTTLKDVAARAGVSAMTVSEVVRESDRVAPETRQRVLEAMRALQYEPHHAARAMRLDRSFTIAYVAASPREFADPAMGLNLEAMLEHFDSVGYNLNIQTLGEQGEQALGSLRRALRQRRIDGAIIAALPQGALLEELASWPHPMVFFDQPRMGRSTVWAEYRDGIAQLVRHLAERGRRRIAFVAGPPEAAMPHYLNTERLEGYLEGLRSVGSKQAPIVVHADYTMRGGATAARTLLEGRARPDAIIAASDPMAFGAIQAASALGLKVPSDIAIAGFNDFEIAQVATPALTTVRFPIRAMAVKAAELLLRSINDPSAAPERVAMPVELVVRDSA